MCQHIALVRTHTQYKCGNANVWADVPRQMGMRVHARVHACMCIPCARACDHVCSSIIFSFSLFFSKKESASLNKELDYNGNKDLKLLPSSIQG